MKIPYVSRVGGDDPLMRLFSVRHKFPDAWNSFYRPVDPDAVIQRLDLDLVRARFPYHSTASR